METLLDSFINCEEHNLNDVSRILREISTLESSIQQLEEGSARTEARQALIELRRKNDSLNTLYTILLLATEGGTLKNQDGEESDPADIFQSVLDATRKPYAERTRADRHLLTRLAKQCHQCATDPTFVSTKIEEAGVDLSALQQIAIGMQNAVDSRPFGAP